MINQETEVCPHQDIKKVIALPVNCTGFSNNDYYKTLQRYKSQYESYLRYVKIKRLFPGATWLLPTMCNPGEYLGLMVVQYHHKHPIEPEWIIGATQSLVGECDRLGIQIATIPATLNKELIKLKSPQSIASICASLPSCQFLFSDTRGVGSKVCKPKQKQIEIL